MRVHLLLGLVIAATIVGSNAIAADTLDDGQLVRSWFGAPGPFRETAAADYLWVKDGLSLAGKTIVVKPWDDFVFLRKDKRDNKDAAKAGELTELMAGRLRGGLATALDQFAKVSSDAGDLVLSGRFVDVNAGSKAAKFWVGFGAGAATATWDIKLVDATSGELLMALHHRVVSGTAMSEIDDKIIKWIDLFATAARQDFKDYARGKPVKK